MITQRFRPIGWVVGVAMAAMSLYHISLRVAAERARLTEVDQRIAMARRDIRQLETELSTRASLRQLERWNGEVLALSAPRTDQFLRDESQLARFDDQVLAKAGKPAAPPVAVMMPADKPAVAAPAPGWIGQIAAIAQPPAAPAMRATDRAVQAAISGTKPKAQTVAAVGSGIALVTRAQRSASSTSDGPLPQAKARP